MPRYQPVATDSHGLEEELQWARLLASGDPARGMALVTIQKLCTAFHEFAPAWENGALSPSSLDYFKARLIARTVRVLETLKTNGLGEIRGYAQLTALLRSIESAATLNALAALAEDIHQVNHILSDALENME